MGSYTGTTHYLALILFAMLTVASACFLTSPDHSKLRYLGPVGGILFYIVLVATVQTDLIFYALLRILLRTQGIRQRRKSLNY